MSKKNIILSFLVSLLFFSCQNEAVKKPSKLIEEDTMIAIFYDLSVLEALKANSPQILNQHQIDPHTYIYKKYKIDSLQFVENNHYYASNLKKYKKMYEKVEEQLGEQKKLADSAMANAKRPIQVPKPVEDSTKLGRKANLLKRKITNTKN
jgi:hypothetical protein